MTSAGNKNYSNYYYALWVLLAMMTLIYLAKPAGKFFDKHGVAAPATKAAIIKANSPAPPILIAQKAAISHADYLEKTLSYITVADANYGSVRLLSQLLQSTSPQSVVLLSLGFLERGLGNNASNNSIDFNHIKDIKTPAVLTPDERAAQNYQTAMMQLQNNALPEALQTLQNILNHMPNYVPASIALAQLYQQQGQWQQAQAILTKALQESPRNPEVRTLKAKIYLAQNQPRAAIDLLKLNPPLMADEPDYYGALADAYRESGDAYQAAKIYQQLTVDYPENSLWWLGLGTSLETMQAPEAALEAYQKALAAGGEPLQGDLLQYVNNRIEALGGAVRGS